MLLIIELRKMATIKEDYEIITNLIKQEIDKRKKQKQSKGIIIIILLIDDFNNSNS